MDQFEPMRFGETHLDRAVEPRIARTRPTAAEAAIVRLDPGLAFGSGTHPTTALCLRWLDGLASAGELQGRDVLDFGCGSGILALAALKLGAARAVGVDNDPQAMIATADNAERNDETIEVFLPQDEPGSTYPVVVANILASALDALAEILAARIAPAAASRCRGSSPARKTSCCSASPSGSTTLRVAREDDWMRIDGVRNARPVGA